MANRYAAKVMRLRSANPIKARRAIRAALKIRSITYARRRQVFDLYDIAAAVFPGQNAAPERSGNYLICLMVRCRYRT